jgi:hypothetical protein
MPYSVLKTYSSNITNGKNKMSIQDQMTYLRKILPGLLESAVIENILRIRSESQIEKALPVAVNN